LGRVGLSNMYMSYAMTYVTVADGTRHGMA